jgi:Ca2+-binding EF-hand superfamily protein
MILRIIFLGFLIAAFSMTLAVSAQFDPEPNAKKPKKAKDDGDLFDGPKPKKEPDPFKEPKQKKDKGPEDETGKMRKLLEKQAKSPEKETDLEKEAEKMFRKLDRDSDVFLTVEEMPEALRSERASWDADRNDLIDLNEYKPYFLNRLRRVNAGIDETEPATSDDPHGRYRVHRAGRLPKELPAWFARLDVDRDGQIGLYEWRHVWPIAEFLVLDTNGDGLLTPDEMLNHIRNPNPRRSSFIQLVMKRQLTSSDLNRLRMAFSVDRIEAKVRRPAKEKRKPATADPDQIAEMLVMPREAEKLDR